MDAIARGLATRALAEIALIDTGQPVELRTTSTHLQWRRVGDTNWTNLVPLVETGSALDFDWDGTSLGVKRQTETEYAYVDLIGPQGTKGDKGDSLEFQWDGTTLKIRVQGDPTWDSADLRGEQGPPGEADLSGFDTDVLAHEPLLFPVDERSTELVRDATGNLTVVLEKSGAETVKTTTLARTNGMLTTVTEEAGGRTITTTLHRTNGTLTGVTREET